MMGPNIFLLKPSHGKRTTLDKAYNEHVNTIINKIDEEEEERWEVYSVIIEDLISKGKDHYLKEIKYRITDGEDPNRVMLDIIEKESDTSEGVDNIVWYFKRRIEEYMEDDFFKRFLL